MSVLRTAEGRYFRQAIDLRLSLELNLEDAKFIDQGGRIIYVMDANVVVFFMNPALETQHLGVLAENKDSAVLNSAITAEFIFSRNLPGQGGHPALIARSHAEELGGVAHGVLRRSLTASPGDAKELARGRQAANELLESLRQSQITLKRAGEVAAEFSQAVARLATSGLHGTNHLLRLHKKDLIRPLAVHPSVTSAILDVADRAPERIQSWTKLILENSQSSTTNWSNAARDAEALAQVMDLNEAAANSGAPTRYVLLTTHKALFDAYSKWFWDRPEEERRRSHFVLRSVLQYAPILNIAQMPTGIGMSDLTRRTRDALDALLAPLRAVDPRYPSSLSILRVLARMTTRHHTWGRTIRDYYGFDPFEFPAGGMKSFERLRLEWDQAMSGLILLNTELLSRRLQSDLDSLRLLMEERPDVTNSVHQLVRNALMEVESAHLIVNTKVSIDRLMTEGASAGAPSRAPLAIRMKFSVIVGDTSAERVLHQIAQGKDDLNSLLGRVHDALSNPAGAFQGWFFAAYVALRCGRWNTAVHNARRALRSLPATAPSIKKSEERLEISYLLAVATRFALPSASDVAKALGALSEGAQQMRGKDPFGLARALSERASLLLTLLYRSVLVFGSTSRLRELQLEPYLQKFYDNLGEARSALSIVQDGETDVDRGHLLTVQTQLWSNVASARVLAELLPKSGDDPCLPPPPKGLLLPALEFMERRIGNRYLPIVLEAEWIMARLFEGLVQQSDATEALRRLDERGDTPGFDLDRLKLARFRSMLGNPGIGSAFLTEPMNA
jgi:hypothetical protein